MTKSDFLLPAYPYGVCLFKGPYLARRQTPYFYIMAPSTHFVLSSHSPVHFYRGALVEDNPSFQDELLREYRVEGLHETGYLLSGKPEALQNCSVVNESTDSFSVNCAPGFNGGLPQQFRLGVYLVKPSDGARVLVANLSSAAPRWGASLFKPG